MLLLLSFSDHQPGAWFELSQLIFKSVADPITGANGQATRDETLEIRA